MIGIPPKEQQLLDSLKDAVAEALERKRRLGQYAVVWRDGQPMIIGGEESPNSPPSKPAATRFATSGRR
jgi:hypothetical protein